jgi:uroporphyrinogen decarboxylase
MLRRRESVMTKQERMEALWSGQPVDRVPFIHKGYTFCARNTGFAVADIYEHPEHSYQAQARTFEQYGCDEGPFYTFSSYGSWEFGGSIRWPDDRMSSGPSVASRPVSDPEEVFKLELPDPRRAGSVPKMMEFARLQEQSGSQIAFVCGSPFTHAANLCGVNNFMMWLIDAPEAAHCALRLMTDHAIAVAEYFVATFGPERLLARAAASVDSNGLISPKQFEEFAFPYLNELFGKVVTMGVKHIYVHVCGDHKKNLSLWSKLPYGERGMLSIGQEVDLLVAAEAWKGHIIAGNTDPKLVANGTPEQICEACRQNIEKGKQIQPPGGFVFMAGCEIPPTTPPYHIYLMQKAVDEFGWYD